MKRLLFLLLLIASPLFAVTYTNWLVTITTNTETKIGQDLVVVQTTIAPVGANTLTNGATASLVLTGATSLATNVAPWGVRTTTGPNLGDNGLGEERTNGNYRLLIFGRATLSYQADDAYLAIVVTESGVTRTNRVSSGSSLGDTMGSFSYPVQPNNIYNFLTYGTDGVAFWAWYQEVIQ